MTKEEFITKSEQIYGKNRFDYSKVPETFYKTQTIELTCLIHNETFVQTVLSHLDGILKCYKCIDEQEFQKFNEKYKNFVIDKYHEELKQQFINTA